MGRKKRPSFVSQKMLSSRVELNDYIKLEDALYQQCGKRLNIQEILNSFVRSCISGSIKVSGSLFAGKEKDSDPVV
jgi:hypothetical protein